VTALAIRDLTVPGRLTGVSFALEPGTLTVVVGPNGSGKSTLLEAGAGLLPARGQIEWEGQPLRRIGVLERGRRLAWVPQEADFRFAFSVREVVAQGRYTWGSDGEVVEAALAAFDLGELSGRPATLLSGGERQRVMLARAFATTAKTQLWDEPISQLDIRHALEVLALARRMADAGHALLLSLHDLRMARRFDRALLLHRGRLVADGPPEEVLTPAAIFRVFGVRARPHVSLELELPDD
jgi:iron complex transport system ATP-binding protein